jgi:hypothetical protein
LILMGDNLAWYRNAQYVCNFCASQLVKWSLHDIKVWISFTVFVNSFQRPIFHRATRQSRAVFKCRGSWHEEWYVRN